jgi:hypothetical protein
LPLFNLQIFLFWRHEIFHMVPGINPRPISALQLRCRAWYGSLGLIPGPIWKMSCNNLLIWWMFSTNPHDQLQFYFWSKMEYNIYHFSLERSDFLLWQTVDPVKSEASAEPFKSSSCPSETKIFASWTKATLLRIYFRNLSLHRSFLQYKSQCLEKVNVKYVIKRYIWMEIPIQHDVYIWANYSVSSYLKCIPICWNVLI